jgi:hypothetical protein
MILNCINGHQPRLEIILILGLGLNRSDLLTKFFSGPNFTNKKLNDIDEQFKESNNKDDSKLDEKILENLIIRDDINGVDNIKGTVIKIEQISDFIDPEYKEQELLSYFETFDLMETSDKLETIDIKKDESSVKELKKNSDNFLYNLIYLLLFFSFIIFLIDLIILSIRLIFFSFKVDFFLIKFFHLE